MIKKLKMIIIKYSKYLYRIYKILGKIDSNYNDYADNYKTKIIPLRKNYDISKINEKTMGEDYPKVLKGDFSLDNDNHLITEYKKQLKNKFFKIINSKLKDAEKKAKGDKEARDYTAGKEAKGDKEAGVNTARNRLTMWLTKPKYKVN